MKGSLLQIIDNLVPGDRFDLAQIQDDLNLSSDERDEAFNEFQARGYVLDTHDFVGEVSICPNCDGEGNLPNGKSCPRCEGASLVVDFGRGLKPYHD